MHIDTRGRSVVRASTLSLVALFALGSRAQAQDIPSVDPNLWCNAEGICHSICNSYEDWSGPHWYSCSFGSAIWPDTACGYDACTSLDRDICVLNVYPERTCTTGDGREGKPICQYTPNRIDPSVYGDMYYECKPTAPLVTSGSAFPKYVILSVVYAPPGSKNNMSGTEVTYGRGNKLGTTLNASSSLKDGTKLSVSSSASYMGSSSGFDYSVSESETQSSSSSMSVTKSEGYTLTVAAPGVDGIDHDWDQIWVNLEPELVIDIAQASGCESCSKEDSMSWRLAPDRGTTISVLAGELKGTIAMRDSIAAALANHGLSGDDLNTILNADPLAWQAGDSTEPPDSQRFKRTGDTFPFVPPPPPGNPNKQSYTMISDTSETNENGSTYEYSVSMTFSASFAFTEVLNSKLSYENSWSWTCSQSEARSSASNTQAMVTIGSPSQDYRGPASIGVYLDTLYGTYAFVGAD